ncbi:Co2+/Mg2+ efflux protein ApaG [Bizionia argentinensis JUB59]|uniref:Co2+/Mg2+ efflux protein ApaG n=1 Tax=Bizionia argentinensis JUB59 TaxID=1046627 RepID=G2EBV1_9FLAO|nr:Co2+/Mg2+ efflux protein ApaG [Bizionia argentinensis]EGV44077.1 Co2+/Mg2+ efflux protein ApaG [Bizionia argentinensis JUB59]
MVQQVTKGIKISVETHFEGTFYKDYKIQYAFGYTVTIENQSKDLVQLEARAWTILDALDHEKIVAGEGVIGKKPILQPGDSYTYSSGCLLGAPFGAMSGYYKMINLETHKSFNVAIPTFRLNAPFAMN